MTKLDIFAYIYTCIILLLAFFGGFILFGCIFGYLEEFLIFIGAM
jgi:hypothetical protein